MRVRQVPPVLSTVAPGGLARGARAGASAAAGRAAHDALTRALVAHFGVARAALLDSGTSALVRALRLAMPAGGVVAMPGYGCIDLSAAAAFAGVGVRLYDLDPRTMSPDLDDLRRALRAGARAVVVAHLYGYPADVVAVRALAREHGAVLIEDAAQAAGGRLRGTPLGAFGDLAVLSFGRGKGVTGGSGGALLLGRDAGDAIGRAYADAGDAAGGASAGWSSLAGAAAQWVLARPAWYGIPASLPFLHLGEMVYHPAHEPRAMPNGAAALASDALARLPLDVARRTEVASQLAQALGAAPGVAPAALLDGAAPGYLRLAVRAPRAEPAPALGILRSYPSTLAEHAPLRPLLQAGERAGAGAIELRDHLFTLPTHHLVRRRDIAATTAWARAIPPISP